MTSDDRHGERSLEPGFAFSEESKASDDQEESWIEPSAYAALAEEQARTSRVSRVWEARARRAEIRVDELERAVSRLRRDRVTLGHRLAVSEWKLASLRRRRWWRLGAVLGAARRSPRLLWRLPIDIAHVIRSSSESLPRPQAPPLAKPGSDGPRVERPQAPVRPLPVLAVLDTGLHEVLRHELAVFIADPTEGEEQFDRLRPLALIVDGSLVGRALTFEDAVDLADVARRRGIPSVLWGAKDVGLQRHFDVQFAPARLVEPRLHHPPPVSTRTEGVAVLDLDQGQIVDPMRFNDSDIWRAVRQFRVVTVVGSASPDSLAVVAATGTPIVRQDPAGQRTGLAVTVRTSDEAEAEVHSLLGSEDRRARLGHAASRAAMRYHSLSPELDTILRRLNLTSFTRSPMPIDVMVPSNRIEQLDTIFDNVVRQTWPNVRLVLVEHGIRFDRGHIRSRAQDAGLDVRLVTVDESVVLGDVFNRGFEATESEYVAKMDDDDFYAPEYLWDLWTALDYSAGDVVGKWAHYVYLEGTDTTVFRFRQAEHSYTDVVAISTILMRRDVLDLHRFPAIPFGSGSRFLRALGELGVRVYAADRWNYLYYRHSDRSANTFPISDHDLMSQAEVVVGGYDQDFVLA